MSILQRQSDESKQPRYWDGEYDTTHTGEIELPEPTEQDRAEMFDRYKEMPNPLAGKDVVVIQANSPALPPKVGSGESSKP